MQRIPIRIFYILIFFLLSCNGNENGAEHEKGSKINNVNIVKKTLELSLSEIKIIAGQELIISVNDKDTVGFDSILIYVNEKKIETLTNHSNEVIWNSRNEKVGNTIVKAVSYHNGKIQTSQKSLDLLSDIVPENYTYKIENIYPHDSKAYTQGLFWHEGFLFESTGLKGASTLRKVDLETGSIVESYIIRDDFFAEGITCYKDQIIQLTWRSNVGFVYNLKDFSLKQKFNYPTEGWGITTIGDSLVMSDGTATLYYLNAQNFSELSRIEIYDDKGMISYLNELEYVNGEIWANIYGKETIVCINPKNGKVLRKIDFGTILSQTDMHQDIDVFNGIAFDSIQNRIFVTGKNWMKLYEVKVFKK